VGQPCTITLEAYPDTSFGGHLATIGNLARPKYHSTGPNVFDISVELDQKDVRFRPGMLAKVTIMVDVLEDEIFVPIEAVFDKDGRTVVYVKRGSSFQENEVEVGKRNDTHVIIRSGLGGDEEVALLDPTQET